MNHWADWLAETPPTLQRLIARTHRISLPRGCDATVRVARLRAGLCHARTVRSTYFAQPSELQAALQTLRGLPRGLSEDELVLRFGPLRPLTDLLADCTPRSLSERLVMLGWLLPRPATLRHPLRYLLPPELRSWLPRPLAIPDAGPAPDPLCVPPALRVATTLLLACAADPLPLRCDGGVTVAALRRLQPQLAPYAPVDVEAQCRFVLPLLTAMGLLAPHGTLAALAPAGQRFLALSPAERLARLHAAWLRAPRPDAWLTALLVTTRGMDWPLLRRRLCAWAAALPVGRLLDPTTLYTHLSDALGPLADAQTHGLRAVDRAPWQPKRAAAIFAAALRGPLTWLGLIDWADRRQVPQTADETINGCCFTTPIARAEAIDSDADLLTPDHQPPTTDHRPPTTSRWHYGAPGEIIVPHVVADAQVLALLAFVDWQAADGSATTYRLSRLRVAHAIAQGYAQAQLRAVVERQAGPPPADWMPDLATAAPLRISYTAVIQTADPATLDRASQARSVRRALGERLAPGLATVPPEQVAALVRALERQDLAVTVRGDPSVAAPLGLSAAECATLLAACAFYRAHAPADAPLLPSDQLDARLRAALPPLLRTATADALATLGAEALPVPLPAADPVPAPPAMSGGDMDAAPTVALHDDPPHAAAEVITMPTVKGGLHGPLLACVALVGVLLALLLPVRGKGRRDNHVPDTPNTSTAPASDAIQPDLPCPVEPDHSPAPALVADPVAMPRDDLLAQLRHAITRRQVLAIGYRTGGTAAASNRHVRPLRLEQHGDHWYLHAYCTLRQSERVFRLDRIVSMQVVGRRPRSGDPLGRRARPAPLPAPVDAPPLTLADAAPARTTRRARTAAVGFFPPPPAPPSGSPLVRVWLEE